jgi:UDPglucose 6-dehydrogenase
MRVTVAGTGYVGTVTGACLAYLGHRVTCVDKDRDKIAMLRRGEMQIYEPHLTSLVHLASARSPIEFSDDLATAAQQSDVIIIAVGTPSRQSGAADLTDLESVARAIGAASDESRFRVIVNKSTVPVGSGNLVETLVREGVRQSHPGERGNPLRSREQP